MTKSKGQAVKVSNADILSAIGSMSAELGLVRQRVEDIAGHLDKLNGRVGALERIQGEHNTALALIADKRETSKTASSRLFSIGLTVLAAITSLFNAVLLWLLSGGGK